jgi:hypothetical protein
MFRISKLLCGIVVVVFFAKANILPELTYLDNPSCGSNAWTILFQKNDASNTFGAKIPKAILEQRIKNLPPVIQKQTDIELVQAQNFRLTGIDVPNQRLNVAFDIVQKKWHYVTYTSTFLVWTTSRTVKEIKYEVNCDGSGTITPIIDVVNHKVQFLNGNMNASNCNSAIFGIPTGLLITLAGVPIIFPIIPQDPLTQQVAGGLITNFFVNNFISDAAKIEIAKKNGTMQPLPDSYDKELSSILQKLDQLITEGKLEAVTPALDAGGLWVNFRFSQTANNDLNTLISRLNNVYSQTPIGVALNVISNAMLGRNFSTLEFNNYYNQVSFPMCQGLNDVVYNVNTMLQAENINYLSLFDENDNISTRQNQLIISLAGGGPYLQNGANKITKPIEVLTNGEIPLFPADFSDGIYKTAAKFVDNKTVGVIGFPWLKGDPNLDPSNPNLDFLDAYWGPDKVSFATKVQGILGKMASNTKIILVGKSMGGCLMQQLVEELNIKGISVEMLILVDASCTPGTSQASVVKNIPTNVKRVYNFYQTQPSPSNDGQNGFKVSYGSPTTGQNIDVANGDLKYGQTLCGSVGHDNIDDCDNLKSKIAGLIREVFPMQNINAIINVLLLD